MTNSTLKYTLDELEQLVEKKCTRGLLCNDCNLTIGRFGDSIKLFFRAIKYLMQYS